MKTQNPIVLPFLIIILLLGYIYVDYQSDKALKAQIDKQQEYWEKAGFKTDTLKIQSVYVRPQNVYPNYVGPKYYYTYQQDTSSNVLKYLDSVMQVNDSLGRTLATINSQYIKKFPTNPKLIYGEFSQDTLRLDLLSITGQVNRFDYPVNFRRFRYQWADSLRALEISNSNNKPLKPKPHYMGLYAHAGYDFLLKQPIVSADINWGYKKFRIGGELKSTINTQPTLFGNAKLGYRLR